MKFTTTKDAGKYVNVLVYGRSGVGKTCLIPTAKSPIIISTEKGLLSISGYNIPVIEVANLDDLDEAYDFISKPRNLKKYSTVALDSISDIAEAVLANLVENTRDPRRAYGELNTSIAKIIRKFRDLPLSTYFIAKAETYENAAGLQSIRPRMPGKTLTNDLSYFFDEMFYLDVNEDDEDNTYRFLQTQPSATVEAKDRSNKLDKVEKPNLKYLFKKMR